LRDRAGRAQNVVRFLDLLEVFYVYVFLDLLEVFYVNGENVAQDIVVDKLDKGCTIEDDNLEFAHRNSALRLHNSANGHRLVVDSAIFHVYVVCRPVPVA